MFFVGSDVYDNDSLHLLLDCIEAETIIVGDLFCNKRMHGGDIQLIKFAEALHNAGKKVCFRTPMYLTSRCFSDVVEKIEYLCENNIADSVILQNMGLLNNIRRKFPNIKLIWNCIELGRSRVSNGMYYETVKKFGADCFLTDNIPAAVELDRRGISVMPIYGKMTYNSMNRECYYMHEHNIFDENCYRGCLNKSDYLISEASGMRMSIDGHLLGKRFTYDNSDTISELCRNSNIDVCVYAENVEELIKRLGELSVISMEN